MPDLLVTSDTSVKYTTRQPTMLYILSIFSHNDQMTLENDLNDTKSIMQECVDLSQNIHFDV
jgi:hypothetical protein